MSGSALNTRNRRILYGRRLGRPLRAHQRELMEQLLPRLSVPQAGAIDLEKLFPEKPSEVWLEVGAGAGEHAAWQAGNNPKIGIMACEPFVNGIAQLLGKIEREKLSNIRVHGGDARDVIERLPVNSLSRLFILFPDPWPKKRHWKRRFISPENLSALARVMREGAELRLATDSMDYCAWTLELIARDGGFAWAAGRPADWRERGPDWPETRYEAKAKKAGRACVYLRFRRL